MSIQSSDTLHIQTPKTLLFSGLSIATIIASFILSGFAELDDLQASKQQQNFSNKTPVIYQPKQADEQVVPVFKVFISGHRTYQMNIRLAFAEQAEIQVEQLLNEDYSTNYSDIDLNQLQWQTEGNNLTLDISKALDTEENYYYETLLITLPRHKWQVQISDNFGRPLYLSNTGEAIDMSVSADSVHVSGNFNTLSLEQTELCDEVYCFIFEDAVINKLEAYTQVQVDSSIQTNEYEYFSDMMNFPFSVRFDQGIKANSIELYLPRASKVDVIDLSLLDKIKWYQQTEQSEVEEKTDKG